MFASSPKTVWKHPEDAEIAVEQRKLHHATAM